MTALHLAAQAGRYDVVKYLTMLADTDINALVSSFYKGE